VDKPVAFPVCSMAKLPPFEKTPSLTLDQGGLAADFPVWIKHPQNQISCKPWAIE
jgi:hypothetical protein